MIASTLVLKIDPSKVATIKDWGLPKTLYDVQSFLSFANFYRQSIKGFSALALPLTCLTRKNAKFDLSPAALSAFKSLKIASTSNTLLAHVDPDRESVWEADATAFVAAGFLSGLADSTSCGYK